MQVNCVWFWLFVIRVQCTSCRKVWARILQFLFWLCGACATYYSVIVEHCWKCHLRRGTCTVYTFNACFIQNCMVWYSVWIFCDHGGGGGGNKFKVNFDVKYIGKHKWLYVCVCVRACAWAHFLSHAFIRFNTIPQNELKQNRFGDADFKFIY